MSGKPKPRLLPGAMTAFLGLAVGRSAGDVALGGAGLAAAAGSALFAVGMIVGGGGPARVNGAEYLAIFAQPNGAVGGALDRSPTGSLPAQVSLEGADLIAFERGRLWVRAGGQVAVIKVGTQVVRLGRVERIVAKDGGVRVVGDNGDLTLFAAAVSQGKRRFDRNLIFGD